jgi:hypothetical protein
MMGTFEIRELLVGALNRYGRVWFLVVWFGITFAVAGIAYVAVIKPLYADIHMYQLTIDKVQVLEKKFGALLHEAHPMQSHADQKIGSASAADMASVVDRALDHGLIIESSVCQSQNKHEQHILKLSGSFETFMRFLGHVGGFGIVLNNVVVTATKQGIVAQLIFSNESPEERL